MGSKLYTRGERIFKWVSLVLLLVICVATLAPFVLILASSLTDETTLITYGYSFWPQSSAWTVTCTCGTSANRLVAPI